MTRFKHSGGHFSTRFLRQLHSLLLKPTKTAKTLLLDFLLAFRPPVLVARVEKLLLVELFQLFFSLLENGVGWIERLVFLA